MSHEATGWALKIRGLKPAAKIVLFHLADRHNPDFGCFPSQKTLANDCEISERSVRDHLTALEALGLIRRHHRAKKGAFSSDRYYLAFEYEFEPAAKSAVGENPQEPAAKSAAGRRQNLPPNLVSINLVNEPVNNPPTPQGGQDDLENEFSRLWEYYPRKVGRGAAEKAFIKARKKTSLADIAIPLKEFKANLNGTPMDKIPHCATWLNQERWLDDQTHAANRSRTSENDLAGLGVKANDDLGNLFNERPTIEGPKNE